MVSNINLMESNIQHNNPESPEFGLAERLENFDLAQARFFNATEKYSRLPTDGNKVKISESARDMSQSLMVAMDIIVRDENINSKDKGLMITTLLKSEDQKRVSLFRAIINDNSVDFYEDPNDGKELSSAITDKIEDGNDDEVLDNIKTYYQVNLGIDLENLVDSITDSRNARYIKISKILAKHGLDIVKIGAGISLGLLATKVVGNKHS